MMPKHLFFSIVSLVVITTFCFAERAHAQSVSDILNKVDAAAYSKTAKMEMAQKIVTPSGESRTFKMVSYSADGSEKGLTVYVAPNQVRGMKILTLNDGDDIWTYFPRTNRTRKIASSARNRRVQGSDFTYDDMSGGKMAKKWKGKVIGTEELAGKSCYKLQVTPTESGPKSYTKATVWISKKELEVLRIEYFDLDGDKLKRLDMGDYRKLNGVLIPFRYVMTNLQDGGKTLMKVDKAEINITLESGLFSEAGLGK
jgi:outer membrane lipoprotein-sorting protein